MQTHDAEKALKLYREEIVGRGIQPMIETVNSYFAALASRQQYSTSAIDEFFRMHERGEPFDEHTVKYVLKACATSSNIKSAIQTLKCMKLANIIPTRQIYIQLLAVYSKVTHLQFVSDQYKQLILMDSFKLLQEIEKRGMVDTAVLNHMIEIFAQSPKEDVIEGLILPMYDKLGIRKNVYTFETLVKMYYKKKDFNTVMRLWNQLRAELEERKEEVVEAGGKYFYEMEKMREDLRPTFNLLELYIQIGVRMMDMRMVIDALKEFLKLKRCPKNSTLKFLGNLKGLPQEILVVLMEFPIRFGQAKLSKNRQNSEKLVQDPQNRK